MKRNKAQRVSAPTTTTIHPTIVVRALVTWYTRRELARVKTFYSLSDYLFASFFTSVLAGNLRSLTVLLGSSPYSCRSQEFCCLKDFNPSAEFNLPQYRFSFFETVPRTPGMIGITRTFAFLQFFKHFRRGLEYTDRIHCRDKYVRHMKQPKNNDWCRDRSIWRCFPLVL